MSVRQRESSFSQTLVKRKQILPVTSIDLGTLPALFLNETSGEHSWGNIIPDTRKLWWFYSWGVKMSSIEDSKRQSCYKIDGTHNFLRVILAECFLFASYKFIQYGIRVVIVPRNDFSHVQGLKPKCQRNDISSKFPSLF